MSKKTSKFVLVELILCLTLFVGAQTNNSVADFKTVNLTVNSNQFSDIQKLLDEQASRGLQISDISYHSKLKNLYAKGELKIHLKAPGSKVKYEYRAIVTELRTSILQQEMNNAGKKGFYLLRQTPIPLETGLSQTKGTFVTLMEKSSETLTGYEYLVIAYHYRSSEQESIKQAVKEGYVKVSDSQLGRITYLIMERVIN